MWGRHVYLLKSMKRFHTDHLFFPQHWVDGPQEGCCPVAHWWGSWARRRRRKYSGKIGDLPTASHQAVWWQDSSFSHSSPMQNESLNVGVRESNPRQVDKKSGGPQGERGLEFSRRRKGQTFFPLHSLGLCNNNVSCLRTVSGKKLSG